MLVQIGVDDKKIQLRKKRMTNNSLSQFQKKNNELFTTTR